MHLSTRLLVVFCVVQVLAAVAVFNIMFIVLRELLKQSRKAFEGGLDFSVRTDVFVTKVVVPAAIRVVLVFKCSVASFAALLVFVWCVRWVGESRLNIGVSAIKVGALIADDNAKNK